MKGAGGLSVLISYNCMAGDRSPATLKILGMDKCLKKTFYVEISYNDDSEFHFEVTLEGREHEIIASLMKITRGTLLASSGCRSYCYDDDGFEVCAYVR